MIQMHLARGKSVASNRADEMVLAGAAPSAAPGSDPVAHVHRGTSFIVLVDGAIVVFSFYLLVGALFSGIVVDALVGGLMLVALLVYAGYRNRKPWAYWPAVGVLLAADWCLSLTPSIPLCSWRLAATSPTCCLLRCLLGRRSGRAGGHCSTGILLTEQAIIARGLFLTLRLKTAKCWPPVRTA